MAEIAVNFVINKLGPLLFEEINLLRGVRDEVQEVMSERESIRSFLKDADVRAAAEELEERESNAGIKTWVKQVREIANSIEDVIDEFTFTVARLPHHGSGVVRVLQKISRCIKKLKLRHGIASDIKNIRSSLAEIRKRKEHYSFISVEQGPSRGTGYVSRPVHTIASYFMNEADVVGIESTRDELIKSYLVQGSLQRKVIVVVGEGGLGKTTLAGRIYHHQDVKNHFTPCLDRCWQRIHEGRSFKENYTGVLSSYKGVYSENNIYNGREGADRHTEGNLKEKRYIVVFDDVWKIEFWNDIEHALVDNNQGSRILLTTRKREVANFIPFSAVHVHPLERLPSDKAWELFCRKAFESEGYCPPELNKLSHDIVEKCGGLPLAVVAVGGLLSSKNKVITEWQKVFDGLGSKLGSDPHLKNCNRVLSEGFYDLPYELKPCLLYFGLFPESYSVNCARLMRLWIAEGIIPYSKRPQYEVAEEYLNELINGSLVQVSKVDLTGRPRICRVHDLMHEIILRKNEYLEFSEVLKEESLHPSTKTRRISVHGSNDNFVDSVKDSKVRSVFLFNTDQLPEAFMGTIVANFKLTKVVDLEDAPIGSLAEEVGNLFNLCYLSVRNTKVEILPKSIGNLLNLETLDLKHSRVAKLPIEIKNLKKLRYLLVYQLEYCSDGPDYVTKAAKMQVGFGYLMNLEKICFVEVDFDVKEIKKLRKLRKLGIRLASEQVKDMFASIANIKSLEILLVELTNKEDVLDIQSVASPPHDVFSVSA